MSAWNFPEVIIIAIVIAVASSVWLIRSASGKKPALTFVCTVCGRKQNAPMAREWRYCPYCGAPKDAKSTKDLPRRRSVFED